MTRSNQTDPQVTTDERLQRAKRERGVYINTLASVSAQAVAMLGQFVLVRILLDGLGQGAYGVWVTIGSTISVLSLAQIGAGPSLVNALSSASSSSSPTGQKLVSSALVVQVLTALIGCALVLLVVPWIHWQDVFKSSEWVSPDTVVWATVVVALGGFLRLPFALAGPAFRSLQRGYMESVTQVVVTALLLAGAFVALHYAGSLLALAAAQQLAILVAGAGASFYLLVRFPHLRPSLKAADAETARSLGKVGAHFSLASLASYIILSSDNLVITHVLNPEAVTSYAVTLTLCQVVIRLILQVLDAAWPAWSDAAARHDVVWLRAHFRRVTLFCLGVLAVFAALLAMFGRPVVRWWTGNEAAVPSEQLLAAMVVMVVMQGAFLSTSRLITALGAVHITGRVGIINALINVPISVILARYLGVPGVALGTAVGYLATGWVLPIVLRRKLQLLEQSK